MSNRQLFIDGHRVEVTDLVVERDDGTVLRPVSAGGDSTSIVIGTDASRIRTRITFRLSDPSSIDQLGTTGGLHTARVREDGVEIVGIQGATLSPLGSQFLLDGVPFRPD